MPYMRWEDFCSRHRHAHLLVAKATGRRDCDDLPTLRRLVVSLTPRGDFALCHEDGQMCLAVETDYDADRLRTALKADPASCLEGWATYAPFRFDPSSVQEQTLAQDAD